jgi:hypothetical protein
MLAKPIETINSPAGHQSYRNRVGVVGASFQLGRTSTRLPSHLLHLARRWNDGTSMGGTKILDALINNDR